MEVVLTPPLDKINLMKIDKHHDPYKELEGELIAELLCITGELHGTCTRSQVVESNGTTYKRITIDYDIKHKNET